MAPAYRTRVRKIFVRKTTGQNFFGPSGQTLVLTASAIRKGPRKKPQKTGSRDTGKT